VELIAEVRKGVVEVVVEMSETIEVRLVVVVKFKLTLVAVEEIKVVV
jgi:hypothetical protein